MHETAAIGDCMMLTPINAGQANIRLWHTLARQLPDDALF